MKNIGRHTARGAAILVVVGLIPLVTSTPALAARQSQKSIRIDSPSIVDPGTGTANLKFTISWTGSKGGQAPSVHYTTADGTGIAGAIAGRDYTTTYGSATLLNNGCRCAYVNVPIIGDMLYEGTQTFSVVLSSPSPSPGATIAVAQGVGTIYDNDGPPAFVVTDASALDNAGTLTVDVLLTHGISTPVSVGFATADGTAIAGTDYTATSGTLAFPAYATKESISVPIVDQPLAGDDKTFSLNLSNATGGVTIERAQATGTIQNDAPDPTVSIADASVLEGDVGTTTLSLPVALSGPSGREVDVDYTTADGTATAGSDYAATTGTLVFAAGETSKQIHVTVNGDILVEGDETFTVTLSAPFNADLDTVAFVATGTITNDDNVGPKLAVGDATVVEGNSGTSPLTFTVAMVPVSASDVTVDYTTSDGTATAGSDYTMASGTLTIPAGQASGSIVASVNGDTTYEPNETFTLTLSNPVGATIVAGTAVGTITNDDPLPQLVVGDASVLEGNSGTSPLTFTVAMVPVSGSDVTVDYTASDGTATAGSDYTAASDTLTIPAGQTSGSIVVSVNGDKTYEPNENFTLTLSNPVGATIVTSTAVGTIMNDDPLPQLVVGDASVLEGNSGTTPLTFTVAMVPVSASDVTVDYATSGGTAAAGSDYTTASGTLTIPAGQASGSIVASVNGDTTYEPNETFTLTLSNPVGATIVTSTAVGKIMNDDDKTPTALTLKLAKGATTIRAKGLIQVATSGMQIKVSLLHKVGRKYVVVSSKTVDAKGLLDRNNDTIPDAAYVASFKRPAAGAYRFVARYAGNATYAPSKRTLSFKV
jgi:hypothetical protein